VSNIEARTEHLMHIDVTPLRPTSSDAGNESHFSTPARFFEHREQASHRRVRRSTDAWNETHPAWSEGSSDAGNERSNGFKTMGLKWEVGVTVGQKW
jgi:hypothetical protein